MMLILLLFSLIINGQIKKIKPSTVSLNPRLSQKQQTAIAGLEKIVSDFSIQGDETNFQDIPRKVKIICSSIFVLWDYQPAAEKVRLRKIVNYLKNSFVENFIEEKDSRIYLKQSIRYAIGEMAKKDKTEALKLLKEFYEAEESLLSKMNDDEKLELAEDLLEIDVAKSVNIVESIIRIAIPQKIIGYLSKLKDISSASHNYLFGKILTILSAGNTYNIRNELVLQSYVFKETYTVYPITDRSDIPGFDKFAFPAGGVEFNEKGIFRNQKVDEEEVKLYLSASISGFKKRSTLIPIVNGFQISQIYFGACKLKNYNDIYSAYGQPFSSEISSIILEIEALALSNGVTPENLGHLKFIAASVVQNYFADSISNIADDNADKQTDSFTKTRLLENKILREISQKRFSEAENLIFEIIDPKTNQVLIDYLNYSIIADAAQNDKKIEDLDEKLKNISNLNVKIIALFEATQIFIKNNQNDSANNYLFLARQIISNQLETSEKPQMLIGLLSLQLKLETKSYSEILFEIIRTLTDRNLKRDELSRKANIYCLDYKGDSIKLYSQGVVDGGIQYDFGDSSIEDGFSKIGKIKWEEALEYAESIENKFLRSRAVLSVCRLALPKKTAVR